MLQKIDVKGETLQILTSEKLDKGRPTVLAIHGAGDDSHSWTRQCEGLGDELNFVAVDLPGRGGSEGALRDSIPGYAAVAADLIDALDLGPVFLMGHSMGGGVALQTAIDFPDW